MLSLQLLSVAVALFTFTAPSLCDTLEVLNPPHARIGIPSIDFHDGLAQHISSDFAASMQNLPLNHGLKPTRAMKRGPKILEYKLVKPKGRGNAKRADGDNSPALFSFPNCLVCTGKRKDDERLTVRDNFQADQMVGMMLLGGMTGECLFYAQRPPGVTYLPKVTSLSRLTTAYSCQSKGRYRTIWQLWPFEKDSCETKKNYYCLDPWEGPVCCWLNPLIQGPNVKTKADRITAAGDYFRQMSKAMAMTCQGEVFVMIDNPDDIVKQQPGVQPSIWLTHELPTLQDLFRLGDVFKLTAILFETKKTKDITDVLRNRLRRDFVWDESLAQAIKAKKLEALKSGYNFSNATMHDPDQPWKRSSCGSAVDSEPYGVDIFG